MIRYVLTPVVLTLAACAGPRLVAPPPALSSDEALSPDQAAFWNALRAHCGSAYEGRLAEGNASDSTFRTARLVMHVRACSAREIRVPFYAGDDRSRTWVFARTPTGLRLTHDHRHADGTEDAVTQYGGTAQPGGSASVQAFPADAFTAQLLPAAASNVWTVEIVPGQRFAYQLVRRSTGRRFRVEFDVSRPVAAPPAPWGEGRPARVRG